MPLPQRPSYLKYAFINVYNLGLLAGSAVVSVGTGDWGIGLVASGLEALWIFIGADSTPFRRWVDKQHRMKLAEEAKVVRRNRIVALGPKDRDRAIDLVAAHIAMKKELEKNQHWSSDLISEEYARLDSLLDAFIELAEAASRMDSYQHGFDPNSLRRDLTAQTRLSTLPNGDPEAMALAAKNAELLQKRVSMLEEMDRLVQRTRGQMNVIENTFRLLRDQIVSLQPPPNDVHEQLDEIVAGVDAVRAVLSQGDEQMSAEAVSKTALPDEDAPQKQRTRTR